MDKTLSRGDTLVVDIEACNVIPAFRASLQHGAGEEEIEAALGWRAADLEERDARVSGESTYRHLEWMYGRENYPDFVLSAVALHTPSSLGVVGLACKTAETVGEAMACHQRYQHLTNGTAVYRTEVAGKLLLVTEERAGPDRLGSLLMSDYTMMVAVQLLRGIVGDSARVRWATSRRHEMPGAERRAIERFLDAPLRLGASHAQLAFDATLRDVPIETADPELAEFLRSLLEATDPDPAEDPLLGRVRSEIRRCLVHGTPRALDVADRLAIGQRTLQRRLSERGTTFRRLLDSTRRDLAAQYLADPELSLTEVAYLLGFAEQASFYRAFRRWYQSTPQAHRGQASPRRSTNRT